MVIVYATMEECTYKSFRGFYLKVTLTIGNCFPFWLQTIYLLNTLYAIEM